VTIDREFSDVDAPLSMSHFKAWWSDNGCRPIVTDKKVATPLVLTLSPPIPLRLYTLPYWSNPSFLIFDIRALWRSGLSASAPECQKLIMVGLTMQYGVGPFEQQQFGTAGVEGVKDATFPSIQVKESGVFPCHSLSVLSLSLTEIRWTRQWNIMSCSNKLTYTAGAEHQALR